MKGAALLENLLEKDESRHSASKLTRRLSKSHKDHEADEERARSDTTSSNNVKKEVWLFFSTSQANSGIRRWASFYEGFSVSVVIVIVVLDILCSMPQFTDVVHNAVAYYLFEHFACGLFSMEYILRLWSCVECEDFKLLGNVFGRLRWARTPLALIDFFVVTAMYVDLLSTTGTHYIQVIRMVRLLRIVALLKVERKTNSFKTIFMVLKAKNSELIATIFTAAVLMVMSSTVMYQIENAHQPENFDSIVSAMWWSVTALTTVGYGDIYPETPAGKVVGSITAFMGVGLFALPAGILGSGFVEAVQEEARKAHEEDEQDLVDTVDFEAEQLKIMATDLQAIQTAVATTQNEVFQMQATIQQAKQTQNEEMSQINETLQMIVASQLAIFEELRTARLERSTAAPSVQADRRGLTEDPPSIEQRLGNMPSFNLKADALIDAGLNTVFSRVTQPSSVRMQFNRAVSNPSPDVQVRARVPVTPRAASVALAQPQNVKVFNKPRQPPNWNA